MQEGWSNLFQFKKQLALIKMSDKKINYNVGLQKSQCLLLDECFNANVRQNCVWGKLVGTAGRNIEEKQYFSIN